MRRASKRAIKFVRALFPRNEARGDESGIFRVGIGDRLATLPATEVRGLISDGVLVATPGGCRAAADAASWLRRQLVEADPHALQHQQRVVSAAGQTLNLAESPLARLAVPGPGEAAAFLAPHQVEAGERVRRLAERAQLRPRVTMSYNPAHTATAGGAGRHEIGDIAADARRQLAEIASVLPRDCADVVLDVCGLLKGLQLIETERRWPRRSAKAWVLRIGREQLAAHFGLDATAVGRPTRNATGWRPVPGRTCWAAMKAEREPRPQASALAPLRMRLTIATRPLARCVLRCSAAPAGRRWRWRRCRRSRAASAPNRAPPG